MTLGDPSPTDIRQIPAVKVTVRDFMKDTMAARGVLFFVGMENLLLLPEQWS